MKKERKEHLRSCISLSEQIEYMRGYHSAIRGDIQENSFVIRTRETPWFRGFTCGVYYMIHEINNIDYQKLNYFVKKKCAREDVFQVSPNWNDKDRIPFNLSSAAARMVRKPKKSQKPIVFSFGSDESNLTPTNEVISESKNSEGSDTAIAV